MMSGPWRTGGPKQQPGASGGLCRRSRLGLRGHALLQHVDVSALCPRPASPAQPSPAAARHSQHGHRLRLCRSAARGARARGPEWWQLSPQPHHAAPPCKALEVPHCSHAFFRLFSLDSHAHHSVPCCRYSFIHPLGEHNQWDPTGGMCGYLTGGQAGEIGGTAGRHCCKSCRPQYGDSRAGRLLGRLL